jgi:hypothetical protein
VHLGIFKVLFTNDAQENFFKRSITIYIKTAPTCFGVITIIRELKQTQIVPSLMMVNTPKYVGNVLM